MDIIGIDPGPEKSAWVRLHEGEIVGLGEVENGVLEWGMGDYDEKLIVAYEVAYAGRRSGREVGATLKFTGALVHAALVAGHTVHHVPRNSALANLDAMRAYNSKGDRVGNDAALRLRLIERLGKDAVPKSSHLRSALAVALYVWDTQRMEAAK